MQINLPRELRAALYVLTAIGTPVVAYLAAIGLIGELEVALWSAEVSVVAAIATFNLTPENQE